MIKCVYPCFPSEAGTELYCSAKLNSKSCDAVVLCSLFKTFVSPSPCRSKSVPPLLSYQTKGYGRPLSAAQERPL